MIQSSPLNSCPGLRIHALAVEGQVSNYVDDQKVAQLGFMRLHNAAKPSYAVQSPGFVHKNILHQRKFKIFEIDSPHPALPPCFVAAVYTQNCKRNIDEKGIRTPALSDQRIGRTLSWRLRPLGHLTI